MAGNGAGPGPAHGAREAVTDLGARVWKPTSQNGRAVPAADTPAQPWHKANQDVEGHSHCVRITGLLGHIYAEATRSYLGAFSAIESFPEPETPPPVAVLTAGVAAVVTRHPYEARSALHRDI